MAGSGPRIAIRSGIFGVQEHEVSVTSGPKGLLAWAPSGRAWSSSDGVRWKSVDIGSGGVVDVAVGRGAWVAVGRSGGKPWMRTSADGSRWQDSTPDGAPASGPVGAEAFGDGDVLAWVGQNAWQSGSPGAWARVKGGLPLAPKPAAVVGGPAGAAAGRIGGRRQR